MVLQSITFYLSKFQYVLVGSLALVIISLLVLGIRLARPIKSKGKNYILQA